MFWQNEKQKGNAGNQDVVEMLNELMGVEDTSRKACVSKPVKGIKSKTEE